MLETPQTIEVQYGGRRHWFHIYRYTTDQELIDALHRDKITDSAAYEKGILAYTDYYPIPTQVPKDGKDLDECGRMYLLDKSVDTLAGQAVNMALHIMARSSYAPVTNSKTGGPGRYDQELSTLVGKITSDLYSQSKHF